MTAENIRPRAGEVKRRGEACYGHGPVTGVGQVCCVEASMDIDGLTTVRSHHGPKETMDRREAAVKAKGMTVFARIDHAAGAAEAGLALRPTELLVFGNARGGTPVMQAVQTMGIDLP